MPENLLFEKRGRVALLTFNRPERNNALTPAMRDHYFDLLERCRDDDGVRAIVLTGAGKSFSVGADVQSLQSSGEHTIDRIRRLGRPVHFALSIPKPIVCAINGGCAGVSLVHALCCDLRFASENARITTAFARRGLIAEYGISWLLPRLVGQSKALDLLLSARVVTAQEAERIGLVNAVFPRDELMDRVLSYAEDLADNCSPSSMAAIKRQVYADYGRSVDEAAAAALDEMIDSFRRPDVREGAASFIERRRPEFPPLARTTS